MMLCECPKCGVMLRVEENDYMPGCRDMEEVFCPKCGEEIIKVFTSDIPSVYVIDDK